MNAIIQLSEEAGSEQTTRNGQIIRWSKGTQPTESEILTKMTEIQYLLDREYPPIGDQLDVIYHKGIDEWKETIKAVKDKYPKPSE